MGPETTKATASESLAFDLLASGNVAGAVAAITSAMQAEPALEHLAQLCKRAYRELKSVPAMTAVAWEAIRFGLKCAEASPDSETAVRLETRVRGIAYNTSANCWPGWGDAVEISPTDIAQGLKFAERNYELVVNLGLGGKEIGGAHWLVGALLLASGQSSAAAPQFLQAEKAFEAAQLPAYTAMAHGYTALAYKILPESRDKGAKSLAATLQTLRAMESKDAHFFADQLVTAERIFSV
ncbi:hypothetical protein Acid345_2678 [Candidatus Koribacter versatilis Ellin345]|uniref:Uncharacterized protein n=1 Tax=Koribacter versatilis (strain Ellin345) TaxID=204669 RepID=Q1IN71_KORVE|nr:hypothetical protein [Candidatus Koribacter versatilis]ABF41679.1 hypothetical protein Acid345_2678 [Candidatus Koribacter versatilis Ellin345]